MWPEKGLLFGAQADKVKMLGLEKKRFLFLQHIYSLKKLASIYITTSQDNGGDKKVEKYFRENWRKKLKLKSQRPQKVQF